jgi:hypothetical protein
MTRQLGEPIDSYDGLVGLIRNRLAELSVTCEAASALAGLTETHLSKIVCAKRSKVLGRMSLTVILQTLGIRLVPVTDDEVYAPLAARLPKATFNRWRRPRELLVRISEIGGEAAVAKVPELLAAATVPLPEPKPKSAPGPVKRPAFDPGIAHPLPVRRRPLMFGRGTRKASTAAVPEL